MEIIKGGIFGKMLSSDRKVKIIVALGLLGMALILASQFITFKKESPPEDTQTAQFVSEEYITGLEEKLTLIVSEMEGVGTAKVMVTIENGVENVYAQQEKRNTDLTREGNSTEVSGKVYEKQDIEQTYLLVENKDGRKQPLLKTQLQPKIQGVVVVCEGAGNPVVQQNLINVVTTALNISSKRVCVVKINSKNQPILQEEAR